MINFNLDIAQRKILIVGAGYVAKRRLKKILVSITLTVFLNGCGGTLAFLGPASTAAGGGNLARSSFTSVVDYGIKRSTGKSSIEHAMGFAEKHNPDKKKGDKTS